MLIFRRRNRLIPLTKLALLRAMGPPSRREGAQTVFRVDVGANDLKRGSSESKFPTRRYRSRAEHGAKTSRSARAVLPAAKTDRGFELASRSQDPELALSASKVRGVPRGMARNAVRGAALKILGIK